MDCEFLDYFFAMNFHDLLEAFDYHKKNLLIQQEVFPFVGVRGFEPPASTSRT